MFFLIFTCNYSYKDDFKPFVDGCLCLACQNHTRAYTQHLVHTKELLAPILLMIHNTHHYLEFFKMIRINIAKDTLPSLLTLLLDQEARHNIKSKKQSEQVNSISSESPFKKLKNASSD